MIGVRRYYVTVALEAKFRCNGREARKIEVVDLADYGSRGFQ